MNGWIDAPLSDAAFALQVFIGPLHRGTPWLATLIAEHRPDWVVLWGDPFPVPQGITRPEVVEEARRTRWRLWRRALLQEGVHASLLNAPGFDPPGESLLEAVPEALHHRWGHWTEWQSPARPFLSKVIFWDGSRKAELEAWLAALGWPELVLFRLGVGPAAPGFHPQGRTLMVDLPQGMATVTWTPEAGFRLLASER